MFPCTQQLIGILLLLGLACCAQPQPFKQSTPTDQQSTWHELEPVMVVWRAPDRSVTCTLSHVLSNRNGQLVRVLSISDAFDPGKWRSGANQGVNIVPLESSGSFGGLGPVKTVVRPRDGLSWGEVLSEQDLVLETE